MGIKLLEIFGFFEAQILNRDMDAMVAPAHTNDQRNWYSCPLQGNLQCEVVFFSVLV